jgi:hypothetical protein
LALTQNIRGLQAFVENVQVCIKEWRGKARFEVPEYFETVVQQVEKVGLGNAEASKYVYYAN